MPVRALFLFLLLALVPVHAAAEDNPLGWSYVETKDLTLIYFDDLSYLAPHAVRTFTNSLAWQRRTFGWVPYEPTTILLKDLADYGNASAAAVPHGRLIFDIAPQSRAFETYPASERMFSLMNHELVHVATNDISSAEDRSWRSILFGKVAAQPQHPISILYSYLTVPRYTAPRWYLEGSAVFMETWMGGGLGRAQGGYDEMVFRAMVRDNAHFFDPLGLESRGVRIDFQVGANAYLYGTRFITWLAHAYAPEKVIAWLRRDEGSKRYYAEQFQHVFGMPLDEAWQKWIAFEREFQRRNLEAVRKHPITPHKKLASGAVGSISRLYYDEANGALMGAFRLPGIVEHVGVLNTRDGSVRRLADIKRAMLYRVTSFAYDPSSGTAFYTNDNLALRDLMAVNIKSGEVRMLLEDARIGEMVLNPADRSLIGVRHANGLATLVRIPHPYNEWFDVHTFPYEEVPADLDVSSDGRLLSASMSAVNGDQFLRVWELNKVLAGDLRPLSEFRFGQSVPESFVFSRDGRYLYGSSYYTGVSNIFRYEVATGAVEAVSNAESGFFRPVPLADGRLVVLTYTAEGFVPAIIEPLPIKDLSAITFLGAEVAAKHPVVTTWQVPAPASVDAEKLITGRGAYYPPRKMSLANAYPVLLGYKKSVGVGYHANVEDALGLAALGITAAFTPASNGLTKSERPHLDMTYRYLSWRAGLSWNKPDFYDLFGPTKRSRKGLAANFGYDELMIYDEPRKLELKSDLAYYNKLDTLPQAQNVTSAGTRLRTGGVGLHFTDVRRSLGAVDDEKGVTWDAGIYANHAGRQMVPLMRGNIDLGFELPLAHSSFWLRNSIGAADGERANPYANFFLGSFGNNYVDRLSEKRYRTQDAFPGFGINEIGARSYTRHMLEWNLPPRVFESAGAPGFHLAWLRPAVFASLLWTEPGDATLRRRFGNIGGQVDLRFSVLHWYDMTLSLGYAVGYRSGQRAGSELMLSLKIM